MVRLSVSVYAYVDGPGNYVGGLVTDFDVGRDASGNLFSVYDDVFFNGVRPEPPHRVDPSLFLSVEDRGIDSDDATLVSGINLD